MLVPFRRGLALGGGNLCRRVEIVRSAAGAHGRFGLVGFKGVD
jgi:hypothetical protein